MTLTAFAVLGGVAAAIAYSATISTRLPTHPLFFVAGDVSLDTTRQTRATAGQLLREVIGQARRQQGYVEAAAFQSHFRSQVNPWRRVSFDPPPRLQRSHDGTRDWLDKTQRAFLKRTSSLFDYPTAISGTDILGVLRSISDDFSLHPDASARIVILASNMANVSRALNLKARTDGSIPQIRHLVAALMRAHEVPHLSGTCIYVEGGGQIPAAQLSNQQENEIEVFWRQFFHAAGAQLVSWGSAVSFPIDCRPTQS